MSLRCYTVATAAYPIEPLPNWEAYTQKVSEWVSAAAAQGAKLALFPEYGAMEMASFLGESDLHRQLDAVSELGPDVDALHIRLAADHDIYILAASLPVRLPDGRAVNRARLAAPSGEIGVQDKQIMTRWERDEWKMTGVAPLRVFDTELGRIGVLICYDAEFPLLARALVDAGVELILVPSCTDSLAGYWRVRVGAMARALEGQCVVAMASTVGLAPWSPAIDVNIGAGGIFGPSDHGFPDDGVFAVGEINAPGWITASIDLDRVAHARADGGVLGVRHWTEQHDRLAETVERRALSGAHARVKAQASGE